MLQKNRRILVIDDTPGIHQDFRKMLCTARSGSPLEPGERAQPGAAAAQRDAYEIDCALQGQEGLEWGARKYRELLRQRQGRGPWTQGIRQHEVGGGA